MDRTSHVANRRQNELTPKRKKLDSTRHHFYIQLSTGIGAFHRDTLKFVGKINTENLTQVEICTGEKEVILIGIDRSTKKTIIARYDASSEKAPQRIETEVLDQPIRNMRRHGHRLAITVGSSIRFLIAQ